MREGSPQEWRTSTITQYYLQTERSPLECGNLRSIKLEPHIEVVGESSRKQIEKNGEHR